jgi:hypothetical protein
LPQELFEIGFEMVVNSNLRFVCVYIYVCRERDVFGDHQHQFHNSGTKTGETLIGHNQMWAKAQRSSVPIPPQRGRGVPQGTGFYDFSREPFSGAPVCTILGFGRVDFAEHVIHNKN